MRAVVSPWLRQAWRVPFCTTVSPGLRWTSTPSSSSSHTSPSRITSKSIVSVVCMPGASASMYPVRPGIAASNSATAASTSAGGSADSATEAGGTANSPNRKPPTGGK